MLEAIKSYVIRCVDVVARITGIDVEVVDTDLKRIAGTGIYAANVGESLDEAGQIYKKVLKDGEPVFLIHPKQDSICQSCPSIDSCVEKLNLSAPIKVGDDVYGVLGMVCFNDEDRARVMDNFENYSYFVEQIAHLIGSRLKGLKAANEARRVSRLMGAVLEISDRGIIVFNNLGEVSRINSRGRADLDIAHEEGLDGLNVQSTGEHFSEFDEFVVTHHGRRSTIIGQRHIIAQGDSDFSSVLVFNTLNRFKDHISSLTIGESGPGLDIIIGESTSMLRLKAQIKRVAQSTSTVLITGESGTGKELVARAIHAESDRKDQPFIAINCGAIPDTLLESELFGYARGAFSGASPKGRMGKFELAHHGVLFLDEIGTLPLYLQVKLLRVLQERQFCRLGSNSLIDVDVRIIAATNANLQESIRQNMFREDLYYRLNVIPMELPPLRERPQDLEGLTNHFLFKYAGLFNKKAGAAGPQILSALAAYDWPGNVRELENAIEFAVNMMPDEGFIGVEHLPAKVTQGAVKAARRRAEDESGEVEPLAEMEKRALKRALAIFGDDTKGKNKAARALGIGVATLYRKIKELHL